MEDRRRESRWRRRVGWLSNGRWLLAGLVVSLGLWCASGSGPPFPGPALLAVALALALSNLLFAFVAHRLALEKRERFERLVAAQLTVDVLALSVLVVTTGSLGSPFLTLAVVPAVCAALLLTGRSAIGLVLAAVTGPLGAVLLLPVADRGTEWAGRNAGSAIALLLSVSACALLGRRVVHRLREQEGKLERANEELAQRLGELESSRRERRDLEAQLDAMFREERFVEWSRSLASGLREPLGILHARAEKLRLESVDPAARHDAEVLLEKLRTVQRELRSVLVFLPRSGREDRADLRALLESTPGLRAPPAVALSSPSWSVEGPSEDWQLFLELVRTLARGPNGDPELPVELSVGEHGERVLAVPCRAGTPLVRTGPAGRVEPDLRRSPVGFQWMVCRRIAERHGASLSLVAAARGPATVVLRLPGRSPTAKDPAAQNPCPDS